MVTLVPGWTCVWTNLGSSWPHLPTLTSEDQGPETCSGLTPSPPGGPSSGEMGHRWALGEGPARMIPGRGREFLSWVSIPRSSWCPPLLGPGGPPQQVSLFCDLFHHQAELNQGDPPTSLPATLSPVPGQEGTHVLQRHPPGGAQEAPARAGSSWACFPTSLCDLLGMWAHSQPG